MALALVFLGISSDAFGAKLTLFRWNPGYRAESEPAFSREIDESELKELRAGKLPANDGIFRGCYLTHLEFSNSRSPASQGEQPKSEIRKICFSGKR